LEIIHKDILKIQDIKSNFIVSLGDLNFPFDRLAHIGTIRLLAFWSLTRGEKHVAFK